MKKCERNNPANTEISGEGARGGGGVGGATGSHWRGPMMEPFMKNRSLWEGPTLDRFVENCFPWWRKQHEEEGEAETKHYDLTTTIPYPFVQLRAVKAKVNES